MLLMAIVDSAMTGCRKTSIVSVVVPVVAAYIADVFGLPDLHGGLHRVVSGAGCVVVRGQGDVGCSKLLVIFEKIFLGFGWVAC